MLAILAVVAVGVRQWISNGTVPSPATDAEAALGINAFAFLNFPDLQVPGSLSDQVTTWQVAAYSFVTSATDRHDSLVGSIRELVLVLSVLTALLTIAVGRRLQLRWVSVTLAVAFTGIPAIAALARIVSPSAAVAAFWLAVAALSAVVVAERLGRRRAERQDGRSTRMGWLTWVLIAVSAGASVIAVLTSGAAALALLGLLLGFLSARPLDRRWTPRLRGLAILSLFAALVGVSWVVVWGPSVGGAALPYFESAGAAVALGGLVVAAACWPIPWLRPLAIGAVPILLAAAWPGPAQAASLLLGLSVVAILAAGLLDTVLGDDQSSFVRRRRFPAAARLAGATLLVAGLAGALLLPASGTAAATAVPSAEVATWIETQLEPDAVVEVDPLSRAQLVRDGLDPARLTTADGGEPAGFVLGPLDSRTELPLLAGFGTGPDALAVRLVVPDPDGYARAQAADADARSRFGAILATNPNLDLGASAAAALRAGDVDTRLMVSLAAASSSVRLAIEEFTGTSGDPAQGRVFRDVTMTDITDLDPSVGASGTSPEALRWLAQFFQTQQPPYQPLVVVEAVRSLTVVFAAPTPLGLLP